MFRPSEVSIFPTGLSDKLQAPRRYLSDSNLMAIAGAVGSMQCRDCSLFIGANSDNYVVTDPSETWICSKELWFESPKVSLKSWRGMLPARDHVEEVNLQENSNLTDLSLVPLPQSQHCGCWSWFIMLQQVSTQKHMGRSTLKLTTTSMNEETSYGKPNLQVVLLRLLPWFGYTQAIFGAVHPGLQSGRRSNSHVPFGFHGDRKSSIHSWLPH